MKKTIITVLMALTTLATAHAEGIFDNLTYNLRFGYGFGGSMPMGMPETIRGLNSYKLTPNFTLGLGIYKHLEGNWGLSTGLHIENKGMDIDATVKNYKMAIVRGGQSLEGRFTGKNASQAEQWMLTLPLQATYSFGEKVRIKAGPYLSYVSRHSFKGYAYDGYLRVGDPTGSRIMLGSDEGNRGTYDFSDSMRSWQFGMLVGADWFFYKSWGAFFDLSWGFTGVFKNDFNTIEQTMYPVYGTIGVSYKIK